MNGPGLNTLEAGSCFFPENFDSCHQPETGEYQDPVLEEPYGPHEIKLLLEIEINGAEHLRASFFIIVF